jgi:hypothetical protein
VKAERVQPFNRAFSGGRPEEHSSNASDSSSIARTTNVVRASRMLSELSGSSDRGESRVRAPRDEHERVVYSRFTLVQVTLSDHMSNVR